MSAPAPIATEQKESARPEDYTTVEQAEALRPFYDSQKVWQKKGGRDKFRYRILHIHPQFNGMTEEAVVNLGTDEKPLNVIHAVYRLTVEKAEEFTIPGKGELRNVTTLMFSPKQFADQFEVAD